MNETHGDLWQALSGGLQEPFVAAVLLFMLVLVAWDLGSFFRRSGRHVDCRSLMVGIGLLGTFIGIFLGLWEFDTAHIRDSVPKLLAGLKLAFVTSILGMGFSVLVHLLENLARAFGIRAEVGPNEEEGPAAVERRLAGIAETLDARLQPLPPPDLGPIERSLEAIRELLEAVRTDVYEHRQRFTKLDAEGQALDAGAGDWAALADRETGLVWEAGGAGPLTWPKQAEARVAKVKGEGLAGFTDWRLPTAEELLALAPPPGGANRHWLRDSEGAEGRSFPWVCSSTTAEREGFCQAVSLESGRQGAMKGGRVKLVRP